MWGLISTLLAVTPTSVGEVGLRFEEALAAVDVAGDVAGLAAAAQARRDGLGRLGWLTSNPQLAVQPGLRTAGTATGPEAQVTVSQSLNLGGLGPARRAVAREEAELTALQLRALRQTRRIAVATAWLETWAAQLAAEAAHQEVGEARELVARLERSLGTAGSTRVEVATARAFAAEAAALHLEWEGRRVEAGAQLANLLGLAAIAVAKGLLPVFSDLEPTSLEGAGAFSVQVLAGELKAERERAAETRALWATSLQLSLLGGRDFPDQWFGGVAVGVTLPVFEHGEREQAVHLSNTRRLTGEVALAENRAKVTRQAARHELEHSAETLAVVKGQQLPAADEAAALEARLYAMGEATLLELTLLRRQALAARIAAAMAEARFASARATAHELLEAR